MSEKKKFSIHGSCFLVLGLVAGGLSGIEFTRLSVKNSCNIMERFMVDGQAYACTKWYPAPDPMPPSPEPPQAILRPLTD